MHVVTWGERVARGRLVPGLRLRSFVRDGTGSLPGAWFGTANVYVKPNEDDHQYVIANEFLASRLAAMIGLPSALGEVANDPAGHPVWVNALVGLEGQEVAPPDPAELVAAEPDLAAGVFVFDTWILNCDRHDENLTFHPKLGVWIYDHDQALGGRRTGEAVTMEGCKRSSLTYHVLADQYLAAEYIDAWIQRVQSVPRSSLSRAVQRGYRFALYTSDARDAIMSFLEDRRSQLRHLVKESKLSDDGDTVKSQRRGNGGGSA